MTRSSQHPPPARSLQTTYLLRSKQARRGERGVVAGRAARRAAPGSAARAAAAKCRPITHEKLFFMAPKV